MVKFTRLLYAYDEVVVNIMMALLERKDFNKVIFWSSELFYSGFLRELSELVWKLYYDFYALNVPFYKINSRVIKFKKTKNFESLLGIFYILFQDEPTCEIFIITKMLKHKKIAKINNFENIFNIIKSLLKTKKMYHIFNYLKAAIHQDEKETIKQYNIFIKNYHSTTFKKNTKSPDIFAQLINHLIINTKLLKRKRKRYKHLSDNFIQYFKKLHIKHHSINILIEQRKYTIDDNTGIFNLERHHIDKPMSDIFWYDWEYYSKNTPYWQEKYNKYSVTWDQKNIIFPNDDKLEDFYDHYNYELDELPFEVSNKSIKKLKNVSILEFLYKYFQILNIPFEKNKIDIKKNIKY